MIIEKSSGVIIFYIEKNKLIYLLLKYPNYWGFVKDLLEKGEKAEETAIREAKEEANIDKLQLIPGFKETISFIFKLHGKLIRKFVVFFLAEINKKQAKKVKVSWEHEGFRFCNLDSALEIMKHKNEKEMLIKADKFLKVWLKQKKLF